MAKAVLWETPERVRDKGSDEISFLTGSLRGRYSILKEVCGMAGGPLAGVKVVEMTMFQQGPVAGMRLGDLGADVIKIEAKTGDPARGFMKIVEAMSGLKGNNYYFEHTNRNKRGIVLDLKNKTGMEVFLKLIDNADVFINNMSIDAPDETGHRP